VVGGGEGDPNDLKNEKSEVFVPPLVIASTEGDRLWRRLPPPVATEGGAKQRQRCWRLIYPI